MGFGQSISHVFSNLTNFTGRASRAEFWWWALFIFIINLVVSIVLGAINGNYGMSFLGWIVYIILALATLSVSCRRLHDTGKSGWLNLLWLLPCVGPIILIIFWAQASNPGDNQYGGPAPTA